MVTIIYCKSDRLITGKVWDSSRVTVEVANIVSSQFGGKAGDYTTVDVSEYDPTQLPVIALDGSVSFVQRPELVAREAIQASATEKLLALGLTAEEVDAMNFK